MASNDLLSLKGQTALVTGSSSGIGKASALELARAGADIVINYHGSEENADEAVEEVAAFGTRVIAIAADVSSEADVLAMFDQAEDELGPLDIVVSNAGIQKDAALGEMSLDDWNAVIAVNLTGSFLVGREAVRRFRKKGDRPSVSRALG